MSEMPMEIYTDAGNQWYRSEYWTGDGAPAIKYHHHDKYRALEAEVERLRFALQTVSFSGREDIREVAYKALEETP